jgi:hypothetical protein
MEALFFYLFIYQTTVLKTVKNSDQDDEMVQRLWDFKELADITYEPITIDAARPAVSLHTY